MKLLFSKNVLPPSKLVQQSELFIAVSLNVQITWSYCSACLTNVQLGMNPVSDYDQ